MEFSWVITSGCFPIILGFHSRIPPRIPPEFFFSQTGIPPMIFNGIILLENPPEFLRRFLHKFLLLFLQELLRRLFQKISSNPSTNLPRVSDDIPTGILPEIRISYHPDIFDIPLRIPPKLIPSFPEITFRISKSSPTPGVLLQDKFRQQFLPVLPKTSYLVLVLRGQILLYNFSYLTRA